MVQVHRVNLTSLLHPTHLLPEAGRIVDPGGRSRTRHGRTTLQDVSRYSSDEKEFNNTKKEILAQLEKDFRTFVSLYKALILSAAFVGLGDFASADASDSTLVLGSSLMKSES